MTARPGRPALAATELDDSLVALLPSRETLCAVGCVNVSNVVGVNVAIAVNAASFGAEATAIADQYLGSFQ